MPTIVPGEDLGYRSEKWGAYAKALRKQIEAYATCDQRVRAAIAGRKGTAK